MQSTYNGNDSTLASQNPAGKVVVKLSRALQADEIIQLTHGTPLGEFTTVLKGPRNLMENIVPQTPAVILSLRSGEIIDFENSNVEYLDPSAKEERYRS